LTKNFGDQKKFQAKKRRAEKKIQEKILEIEKNKKV